MFESVTSGLFASDVQQTALAATVNTPRARPTPLFACETGFRTLGA
jgi:hypothetical protein